jgi:Domain of unknown function (DUF6896)
MMSNSEKIRRLMPLWYAQRKWAEELLIKSFNLSKAEDILQQKYRGANQISGTNWMYRTHGIGVDIYRTVEVGGIDFDFDKVAPDEWRLKIFFEKQYHEGNLPLAEYRDLAEDEDLLDLAIKEALKV